MAFTNYSDFYSQMQETNSITASMINSSATNNRLHDYFRATADPTTGAIPAIPTTATALSKSNTSALNYYFPNFTPLSPYLIGARVNTAGARGVYLVVDRLSHQGGLDGTLTTAQTTNLPTAALTRYTDGVGVMVGLTIYTSIGSTATTVTVSYTNQAGTAGRTSVAQVFGGSGFNTSPRTVILPLQAGDTGVKSVESVTLAATTGTIGNFGVTLFKILGAICVTDINAIAWADIISGGLCGGIPEVKDDAHLSLMFIGDNTTSTGGISLMMGEA